ncbi:Phosphotransferase enzyme [Myotisia sp. PD_48]|nr:Phosphotransferase enzyme [Myotisia sp. PD_48]
MAANGVTIFPGSQKNNLLFTYTSGRFLFNEDLRLKERYMEFDVKAFKQLAAEHIGSGHGNVVSITKFAEGGFNQVFLLTMEDGFEAIAKISYHIAVPKRYATVSEAATLDLLRLKGIPVPMVYGYSASLDNPSGMQYIIMEKASGIPIESKWLTMTKQQRYKLASSYVEIENKFFNIPFNSIGSIYYRRDIPLEFQAPLFSKDCNEDSLSETFCISHTTDYIRLTTNDPKDFLHAIAERELTWTRKYGQPLELDFPLNGPFPGKHDPEQYIALLGIYIDLIPYLLPKDRSHPLNQPTLRHPDLNPNNVFISPETGGITCIIDWQHTTIEPRLLTAGYPRMFENPGIEETKDLKDPSLIPEYNTLGSEEKQEVDEIFRRQILNHYYGAFTCELNRPHVDALKDPLLRPRQHLVDRAGRQWNGNILVLKGALPGDVEEFEKQEEILFGLNATVEHWRAQLGVNEDGWIHDGQYEDAVKGVQELKNHLLAIADGDEEDIELLHKDWMFRDYEEVN